MADNDKVLKRIEGELENLQRTKTTTERLTKTLGKAFISVMLVGAALKGGQYAVDETHDYTEYNQAKAEMDAGSFNMPEEYFYPYQEKCIKHKLADKEGIDVNDLGQQDLLSLKGKYSEIKNCFSEEFLTASAEDEQKYLDSLAPEQTMGSIGNHALLLGSLYMLSTGMFVWQRRKARKDINRRNNDLKLMQ